MGLDREEAFTEALRDITRRAERECKLPHGRFPGKLKRWGGVGTAKDCLRTGPDDVPGGLRKVHECGRPHLSLEWVVLQPQWRDLFEPEERQVAWERLKLLNPKIDLPEP